MRLVEWADRNEWRHVSMVRDEDPDNLAEQGIPVGPPDVGSLPWEDICREINNQLVEAGVLTWRDAMRQQNAITHIVERVVRRKIIDLFRQEDQAMKEAPSHD
jgi:hypothetical protein